MEYTQVSQSVNQSVNMASRCLVVSEPLCYIRSRLGKIPESQLKCVVMNFFAEDTLVVAKQRLCEDIDSLTQDRPHVANHRDGPNKINMETDDIIKLITFADERMLLDMLPIYVCENIDRLPSTKWLDGDMQIILAKLDKVEKECEILRAVISSNLDSMNKRLCDVLGRVANASGENLLVAGVPTGDPIHSMPTTVLQPESVNCDQPMSIPPTTSSIRGPGARSAKAAAEFTSHPHFGFGPSSRGNHRMVFTNSQSVAAVAAGIATETTENESEFDCDYGADQEGTGQWELYAGSRKKRRRMLSREQGDGERNRYRTPSFRDITAKNLAPHNNKRRDRVMVIGRHDGEQAKLKSTGHIPSKRVYCVSNVCEDYSCADLLEFLRDNRIKAINCFEAANKWGNSKSFRVCITSDFSDRFLDPELWPTGVIVRDWVFKDKSRSAATYETDNPSTHNTHDGPN